jgi:hypothetical protein
MYDLTGFGAVGGLNNQKGKDKRVGDIGGHWR